MLDPGVHRQTRRTDERLRRLRSTGPLREMLKQDRVHPSSLVAPVFVRDGEGAVEPIGSLPGVYRYSVDKVSEYVGRLVEQGIRSVLLFGLPALKDEVGTQAYAPDGVVPRAIGELKSRFDSLVVAADVCLCEYTSHGHCGVLIDGAVSNEKTLPLLARAALRYAEAGADIVAPSAMMDGQVLAVRKTLDDSALEDRLVMGYSAKFASSFYGPFREAARSAPAFGDRRGYQMEPANSREAMREIASDVREGADIIMVKPALAYLDIISKARSRYDLPLAAYSVSGEYSMIKAADARGWVDERAAALEVTTSIRRAGADIIITYFAEQLANWLKEDG
ncbi:MAG TPA: porphobilinogen synthase [Nitrososphaerales archaeon]|nr:porphobilinogen synthase [Nitrososphaerales archaeon]